MKKRICSLLVACFLVISTTSSLWAIGNLNDNEKEVLAALKSTVEVDGSTVGLQDADINTAENYMMQDGFDLTSEQKKALEVFATVSGENVKGSGGLFGKKRK